MAYWARNILQHADVSTTPIQFAGAGAVTTRTVTAFGSLAPPSAYDVSVARSASDVQWSTDNPAVATVSPARQVTATGSGSTWVRIRPRLDRLPPDAIAYLPFESRGDSIQVTVSGSPGGSGPMRVSAIVSPGAPPFTTSGEKTFTATVVNAQSGVPVQVAWLVDRSDNGPGWEGSPVVTSGTTFPYLVSGGSYHLRIQATPQQLVNDTLRVGGAMIADFPVCTGGEPLAVRQEAPPIAQTNRPQGC